jgi:hypothetical protein
MKIGPCVADHHLRWYGISKAGLLLRVGRSLSTLPKRGAEQYFRVTDEPLHETLFGRSSLFAQTLHMEEILF